VQKDAIGATRRSSSAVTGQQRAVTGASRQVRIRACSHAFAGDGLRLVEIGCMT
jgi:hypothetical protein